MKYFHNRRQKIAFITRLIIVALGFISGLLTPNELPESELPHPFLIFAIMPILILPVIGIQKLNPMSSPIWEKGSWLANPFNLKQPLQFFHMSGYFFVASGIGLLAASVYHEGSTKLAIVLIAIGLGVLLGIKLCERLFVRES